MEGPVDVLQYFKKEHVASEQRIFLDYFRDITRAYGISALYFKQENKFPNRLYERFQDLIYEEHIPVYSASAEIRMYLETATDAFMLTKFGIEPDQKYTAYFMMKDFEFAFVDLADQKWVSGGFENIIQISGYSGTISSEFISEDDFISGVISSQIIIPTSGNVDGVASATYSNYNNYIYTNPDIYWPNKWDYLKTTFSSFHGPYSGFVDENGNGEISANLRGVIIYKKLSDLERNPYKKVKPIPKDYFVIPFTEENNEEFEITHVISRNLTPNGINPLLTHYIFACNVQRREYSHEEGLGSSEEAISAAVELQKVLHDSKEYLSDNNMIDYNLKDIDIIDKAKSDRVFGGYGYSTSALPNSPVSTIIPDEYIDPISGIIFEFFFGSSIFSDGEDVYFIKAGQLSGTSLLDNSSLLSLSECSGNFTKIRYLESDGNQIYFINVSGVSSIIETTQTDNIYLREKMEINGIFENTDADYEISGIVNKLKDGSLYSDGVSLYFINKYQEIFTIG